MSRTVLSQTSIAVCSLWLAQSALAQSTTGATVSGDAGVAELGEVLVTAQRRVENLQKTALSIEVLDGDLLRDAGVSKPDELTTLVPGLQVSGGTTTQVYVRGVGDFGVTATANPAVATSLDGVAIARPQAISGNFFDLARVELLKGPQGTLYGRNASGGALNLITVEPQLGEYSGYAEFNLGDYQQRGLEGAFNLSASESSAYRLSYQFNRRDGYLTDGTNDDDHESVRLQARFAPHEGLSVRAQLNHLHLGGTGTGLAIVPSLRGLSEQTGNLDPAAGAAFMAAATAQFNGALAGGCNPAPPPAGNCPPAPAILANPAASTPFQDVSSYGAHLQVDKDLSWGTLTVLPAYRRTDARFAIQPSFLYNVGGAYDAAGNKSRGETSDQSSLEVRLSNDTDQLKWVVGAYAFREKQTNDFALQGGQILNQRVIGALTTDALAAFGQLTYSASDRARLTAGVRYTTDERASTRLEKYAISPSVTAPSPNVGLVPIPCLPATGRPAGTLCTLINPNPSAYNTKATFSKVTWKLGAEYDLGEEHMLFADISTGFKAGGFNQAISLTQPTQLQPYNPETITAYMFGSKNRFHDNRVQLNLEAFYWDYKDLQLSAQGLDAAEVIVLLTQNAGKATVQGLNANLILKAWTGGTLRANVEYVDSEYNTFRMTQLAGFVPPGRTGCTQTYLAGGLVTVDCSGKPLVRSPEWSGNLGLTHEFALSSGGRLTFDADASFAGERYLATDFTAAQLVDSYANLSASLTFDAAGDRWYLGAYARNLTDEVIYTGGGGHQSGFVQGWFTSNIAPPRTYGVRFGARF